MRTISFYIRVFLAWIWFLFGFAAGNIIMLFRWKNPSTNRLIAQFVYLGARHFIGFRSDIQNEERMSKFQPCIYATNHQSNFDILTMSKIYPANTVLIGKKELAWIPFFGTFFVGAGNILIDRKNQSKAIESMQAVADDVKKRKLSVWIFPEGTRNRGRKEMLPFKKGPFRLAIDTQFPIIPIVHEPLKNYLDFKEKRVGKKTIRIKVLEPIPTSGLTVSDTDALMAKVRDAMQVALAELEKESGF